VDLFCAVENVSALPVMPHSGGLIRSGDLRPFQPDGSRSAGAVECSPSIFVDRYVSGHVSQVIGKGFSPALRKIEHGAGLDPVVVLIQGKFPGPVFISNADGIDPFGIIRPAPVVEHDVCLDLKARGPDCPKRVEIFGPVAVLGADRSLLVKLSQIIEIIDAIARVVSAARAFERRRKQSAVIPSSARSGVAEETCFHRAPSADRYQWKYRIIVPLHALMAFSFTMVF